MSKSLKVPAAMTQRMTIVLIAIAAVVLLIGGAGIYFLQTKQADADKIVADKEALVGTNEQVAKRYDTTLASYNSTLDQIKYIEPSMTRDAYVATLVQQLQRATLADHLKLTAIRPGTIADAPAPTPAAGSTTTAAAPPYSQISVGINVQGTYTQIMTFVYHMTKFPKVVAVQSVSFSPNGGSGPSDAGAKSPLLTADITLTAFVFKDDTPGQIGVPAVTNAVASSDNGNLMARETAHLGDQARAEFPLPSVQDRTGGLVESAATKNPAKGGI